MSCKQQRLRCPFCAEEFGLCKDELCRFVLQIGWVAVFSEDPFHHDFDLRAGAFAQRPVDRDALADLGDQFGRDHLQLVVAHHLHGAVVGGERVVERDFVVGQAEIVAALGRRRSFPWRA